MISARWRLERLARYEEEAMNKAIDGPARFMSNEAIRRFQAKSAHRRVLDAWTKPTASWTSSNATPAPPNAPIPKPSKNSSIHRANQAKTAKQNEATAKQNKAKEAEAWLHAELAKLERTRITDPFAGLADISEQNEPNFDAPLPTSAPSAFEQRLDMMPEDHRL